MNIAHAYQTGIGLPDRDYYFKSDLSTVAIQNRTKKYLTSLFQQNRNNTEEAKRMLIWFTILKNNSAVSHKTKVELGMQANYNKMAVTDLVKDILT
jgi:putative endopeptidase